MPFPRADPEQIKLRKQERNQRYLAKSEKKEKKRERDRIYRQRKREQIRLQQHTDPLAQLADVETQQIYIAESSFQEKTVDVIRSQSIEAMDVSEIILEDGEIIEGGFGNDDPIDSWLEPDIDVGPIEPNLKKDVDEVINENERRTRFEGYGPTIIDLHPLVTPRILEGCG